MKAADKRPAQIFVVSEYSQPGRPNQEMYAFAVSIDRTKVGRVLPQQSWAFSVEPGTHVVRVKLWYFTSRPLTVNVPAGGSVVLKTDIYRKWRFLRAFPPAHALRLWAA
jgi:hypothetical protein